MYVNEFGEQEYVASMGGDLVMIGPEGAGYNDSPWYGGEYAKQALEEARKGGFLGHIDRDGFIRPGGR